MTKGAWQTCPECGHKCLGYRALGKHMATHPGLIEREKVADLKRDIERIQESIAETEAFERDLTLPLSPEGQRLIRRQRDSFDKAWGAQLLKGSQERLATAEVALAQVMQAEADKEAQNAEAIHTAVQTVAARLREGG